MLLLLLVDLVFTVKAIHQECVAQPKSFFQYYGHREKLRLTGMEDLLEPLNLTALRIARDVADRTNTLMAGNICNSTIYERDNSEAIEKTRVMFKVIQCVWCHFTCSKVALTFVCVCVCVCVLSLIHI